MIQIPQTYELIFSEWIEDVHSEGYLLRHKKSGARIALLANEDENKVFNIAFRTPPADSTGVAHILEHSVLCGSKKFPLKDPFVELVKGSLNTFLNAMTFPDKTMYPVASCNDKDFQNLTDVYLDAVFHPNIYENPKIFYQEGWHYDLASEDAPLTYNGVVYNEMKGAFSSSDDVLERSIMNTLFPETPYGVESGGDPEDIPKLTYEQFLEFHRRYYHPSNSYIYFYGNMNMEEKLNWLDEAYLSEFEEIRTDSEIPMQNAFSAAKRLELPYPVLDDEPLDGNAFLSRTVVTGDACDVELNVAMSVLSRVLLTAPGAPVKQALLDAGIGRDIDGGYEDGILQPYFSIIARKADPKDEERFLHVIEEAFRQQAEDGLDQKALESALNYYEFLFREADFNYYPKGLIYGIDMFHSWLYDDRAPFDHLKVLDIFAKLKGKIGSGYFENLIQTYLLSNPHCAVVTLVPKRGLAKERDEKTAERLSIFKQSLEKDELLRIIGRKKELEAYQEAEDDEETIRKLPLLARSDIDKETGYDLRTEEEKEDTVRILYHDFFTNGIGYLKLLFDASHVPDRLIPYIGLLKSVLGYVSTEHFDYGALYHEINANTGGIFGYAFTVNRKEEDFQAYFAMEAKYLYPKQAFVFEMLKEILLSSRLEDKKRLREILASVRADKEYSLAAAGNAAAAARAESYYSKEASFRERVGGIDFLHFIEETDDAFEHCADELIANLQELMKILFRKENLTVSLTYDAPEREVFRMQVTQFANALHTEAVESGSFRWEKNIKNEGFMTAGQVQYVAAAFSFAEKNLPYTGGLKVLRVLLNYGYLWNQIRVKGGAYGCGSSFSMTGQSSLTSYRDPNLKRTLEVYRKLPEYLRSFEADEREMTKYIIGAISSLAEPRTPSAKGRASLMSYLAGITQEDLQKERDELLNVTVSDIRSFAEYIPAEPDRICVIGSEAVLERDADCLKEIKPLIRNSGITG